jgi:hypothetical protein
MNAKTDAAMRALGMVPATTPASDADEPQPVPSFDGGARRDQPALPSPDHGQWLTAVLRGEVTP